MSTDHGQFSGIAGVTRAKQAKSIDREIDKAIAAIALRDKIRKAENRASRVVARKAEADRVKFTAADLAGAKVVRDRRGWHLVVRVNAKTVSVFSGYSWPDRIALDKILDFRS